MSRIATINPATGRLVREFQPLSNPEILERVRRTALKFESFRGTDLRQRSAWMERTADHLEVRERDLGRLISLEMGKPLHSAIEEIRKCAWNCRHYAENAHRFLAPELIENDSGRARIHYEPLGVILGIMPWNFPFWQVFRFAVPTLMAGNVILLKHASNVPQCALQIEAVFREGGLPENVFQTLLIESSQVEEVIACPEVAAVTLTGSVEAGRSVASAAGRHLKKSVLELGGSDPFIVSPSADLDRAVQVGIEARTLNAGQSCVAAKRFILAERIAPEFTRRFVEGMRKLRIGDPFEPATQVGPLASEEIRERVAEQVRRSIEMGARVLLGGGSLEGPGYYYAPTVLDRIPEDSPASREEVFGPVASLFVVSDIRNAVTLANSTQFGLGAAVFTRDEEEMEYFSKRLESGSVFMNEKVASDPRLPFGGVKNSGYGRELGREGIREFVNIKTVSCASEGRSRTQGGSGPGQPNISDLE